jgi:hypothetical protein
VKISHGGGAQEEAAFRAVYAPDAGQNFLYLSWQVKVDPSLLDPADVLFVGFGTGAGSLALKVSPFASPGCREAGLTNTVTAYTVDAGGVGTRLLAAPSWADQATGNIKVWSANNVGPTTFCAGPVTWAVHMRVPTNNISEGAIPGLNLGSDFRMWYEVRLRTPPDMSGMAGLKRFKTPAAADSVTQPSPLAISFPPPGTWADFHLSTGTSDAACTGAVGISLEVIDVGTRNNDPVSGLPAPDLILFRNTAVEADRPQNIFFVSPKNNIPGFTIPAGALTARIRVANWGSVATPGPWEDIPNGIGLNVTHAAPIPPTMKGNLEMMPPGWRLDAADITHFATGPSAGDKCILVELSSNLAAPNNTFINDSVYRNMTFAPGSVFRKGAEINIKGLPASANIGPQRDVYLYVQTLNMPAPPRTSNLAAAPGQGLIKAIGRKEVESLVGSVAAGRSEQKDIDAVMPTYRVFVYHDTGQRDVIEGVTHKVLESQPSFGYYMVHEGMIEGWRHKIEGAQIQEINPNYYRIFVPNDGHTTVTTTIEAVEPGGTTSGPFKRWGLSLHAGISIPHGNFNTFFDPGPNFAIDLEYRVKPTFSLEAIYGLHHFNGATIGTVSVGNLNVHQFSFNGKVYGSSSPVRPFFNFGGGAYKFGSGSTRAGLNIGAGVQFDVTPTVAAEAMYDFHNVFTSGSSTRFSAFKAGFRFRF